MYFYMLCIIISRALMTSCHNGGRFPRFAARQRITDQRKAKGGAAYKIPSALRGNDGHTITNEPILLFARFAGFTNSQFNGPFLRTALHQHQQRLRLQLLPQLLADSVLELQQRRRFRCALNEGETERYNNTEYAANISQRPVTVYTYV